MLGIIAEFKEFLKEYKVLGLAVAVIIGTAATALIQSLVNNILMPVIGIGLPNGDWQTANVLVGPAKIVWGAFLSSLINFVIIAFVVFLIVRTLFKEEKVTKK